MRHFGKWPLVGLLLTGTAGCRDSSQFQLTKWTRDPGVPTNVVRIHLIDSNGQPVSGAIVGDRIEGWDAGRSFDQVIAQTREARIRISPDAEGILIHQSNPPAQMSGGDGTVTVPATNLFGHGFITNWQSNRYEILTAIH